MAGDTLFVFVLIGVASLLFASGRVRLDMVALGVLLALALSGVLTPAEAVSGFGDPVVILVAGLLVLGEALTRTGVAHAIGAWLLRVGGTGEARLMVMLMLVAAVLGSVMSSTAVVAILIPVTLTLSREAKVPASRLLLPMSFAALVSGMMTLIGTTPNLVVAAELDREGHTPFGMFSFTPIGASVLLVAVVYMVFIGRRLLPSHVADDETGGRGVRELLTSFEVEGRFHRLGVPEGSSLVGESLAGARVATRFGGRVVMIERTDRMRRTSTFVPIPETMIRVGDVLVLFSAGDGVGPIVEAFGLRVLPLEDRHGEAWLREIGVAEVLIHPESRLLNRTIRESEFRSRFDVLVMGMRRKTEALRDFVDLPLAAGDALLVIGPWERLAGLQSASHDFVVLALPIEIDQVAPARRRAPWAIAALLGMVVLSALKLVPVVVAVLIAALVVILAGCLSLDDAYRSMHWSSLVLIAGILPVATALEQTGGVALVVDGLVSTFGSAGPGVMLTALFFLAAGLGLFLSNTATAVLVAPIAIEAARVMGVDPYVFAMTVAIAASAAFMTPVSTPVVTLVVEPGGYRFADFLKIGIPLVVLTWLVTLLVTPLVFGY